ncbi:MAG: DUF1330 domain-containing protein [Anaerolineae bacterium]|nr:DUF1330 domain-containing protein [Anaerolineae bacterium]
MSAYVFLEIEVTDPEVYEAYKKLSPAAIAAYGGKYLVRGGKSEVLEGDWQPQRIVILEFENTERAKAWLNSPEYRPAWEKRKQSAKTRSVLLEGYSPVL